MYTDNRNKEFIISLGIGCIGLIPLAHSIFSITYDLDVWGLNALSFMLGYSTSYVVTTIGDIIFKRNGRHPAG